MAAMTLKQIEEKVRSHVITPAEKRAQRVSLAVGLQPYKSALTREEISSLMGEIEGHDGAATNHR
ncbi:hypothetical protein [Mesorhizobium sp. ANAO-SY3R2]|uniref:hypothetical protein n=1 Tax=Mesorhizobium sp. ANAO-SY3R2 TaxID=3166644 RepID=UPI0036732E73